MREHFGPWRLVDVTAEAIDKHVLAEQAEGRAAATINRATQILGQALRLAHRRGKLATLPYVRHLSERNARQGFFERAQYAAVMAGLSPLYQHLCTSAYHTGWRRSEVLGLTWERVDIDAGTVRLADSKNGSRRAVALNDELRELILRRQHPAVARATWPTPWPRWASTTSSGDRMRRERGGWKQ